MFNRVQKRKSDTIAYPINQELERFVEEYALTVSR